MLLDWGKQQAEPEVFLIGRESSELARPLYVGFSKYGNMYIKDFLVEYMPILLLEPKGLERAWSMTERRTSKM